MSHKRRPISVEEILAASGAEVAGGDLAVDSFGWIERNSREIVPGDLFIAVRGERFDGHAFVEDAALRGASAALVSKSWSASVSGRPPLPLLIVDDPVLALQQVAARRRDKSSVTVVGVTGSIGKTSTKEAIAAGIQGTRRVYRSPGNMNSEIGLPLSLLEMPPGTEVAVLEMGGAYAAGELALLAKIARPAVGVVTNVHPVHLERMGSIEAIAKTKAELVEALPPDGAAVLNVDNSWVREMIGRTSARVIGYGQTWNAELRFSAVRTRGADGIAFDLHIAGDTVPVELPMVGVHAAELAVAAIGVGLALGVEIDDVLDGLRQPGCQVRLLLVPGPGGSQLIDDTYNASAPSMLSALRLLGEMAAARKIAVLGDMRELGAESDVQHVAVGRFAAQVADQIVTFGSLGRQIGDAAREAATVDGRRIDVQSFDLDQREELTRLLKSELRSGDTALLKGSRGLEMETIVEALREAADNAGADV